MFGEYLHFLVALLLLSILITVASSSLEKHRIADKLPTDATQAQNPDKP
jgi:hypothetical protein